MWLSIDLQTGNKLSMCQIITTLALGLQLRQGLAKVKAKKEAWE
jgi:hypothetical protein